jgi:hypothetical protein
LALAAKKVASGEQVTIILKKRYIDYTKAKYYDLFVEVLGEFEAK